MNNETHYFPLSSEVDFVSEIFDGELQYQRIEFCNGPNSSSISFSGLFTPSKLRELALLLEEKLNK